MEHLGAGQLEDFRGGVAKSKRRCVWPRSGRKIYLHFGWIPPENMIVHLPTYMENMVASIEQAHDNAVQRKMSKRNSTVEIIQGSKFEFQKLTKKVGRPRLPQTPRF